MYQVQVISPGVFIAVMFGENIMLMISHQSSVKVWGILIEHASNFGGLQKPPPEAPNHGTTNIQNKRETWQASIATCIVIGSSSKVGELSQGMSTLQRLYSDTLLMERS